MTFHIITIFPEIFDSYFKYGVIRHALEDKIRIKIYNLRDFTTDKHRQVDDTVYGGGAGMLLKVDPIWRCVEHIRSKIRTSKSSTRVVLFSAKGKKYTQQDAKRLKKYKHVILLCGRYEGVDERVARHIADEEISIGEFVLTGGEIPAMIVIDSIARTIPGVLGNEDSFKGESFYKKGYIEPPQYTKPMDFQGWKVPKVLLSGNHRKIKEWRKNMSEIRKS